MPHVVARCSRVVLGATLVAVLLGPEVWSSATITAVVALGLAAGLPHGAIDHVLAARLAGISPLTTTTVYLAGALAAWAALTWGGPVALAAVLGLSVVHFGAGEVEAHRATGPWPGGAAAVVLAVAGTGALLLPLARADQAVVAVADALSPGLGSLLAEPAISVLLAGGWAVAALGVLVLAVVHRRAVVAADVVLVGAVGALAPPLVAFALWFGGWHALRHTGRLLVTEPGAAQLVDAGQPRRALARLARLAAAPSAVALAAVVALALLTAGAPEPDTALATALRVLLALTVPHMVVVAWLDRRPGRAELTDSGRYRPAPRRGDGAGPGVTRRWA